jgi:LAGLIDADG endonuclease
MTSIILFLITILVIILLLNKSSVSIFKQNISWVVIIFSSFLIMNIYLNSLNCIDCTDLIIHFLFNSSILIQYKNIEPYYVTGLADGDGSFYFTLNKNKDNARWYTKIGFEIVAENNPANYLMLKEIHYFFNGIGSVYAHKINNSSMLTFIVRSVNDCIIIRNHFEKYPLFTYKLVNFILWSQALDLMIAKEHLTLIGLLKLVALKAQSPKGLSLNLIKEFPNYTPINLPEYKPDLSKINIHWICGFINSDGSFSVYLVKNNKAKFGYNSQLRIVISQHNKSLIVFKTIKNYFNVGKIYHNSDSVSDFKLTSLKDILFFIDLFKDAQLKD